MPHASPPARLRKVAAVGSSVVLVALYIAYRSGGQTTTPVMPSSKFATVKPVTGDGLTLATTTNPAAAATSAPAATVPFEVFSTSKSGPVVRPEFFGGSKSVAVFKPGDAIPLTTAAAATQATSQRVTTAPVHQPVPARPAIKR